MIGRATYPSYGTFFNLHIGRCSHDTAVQVRVTVPLGYFACLVLRYKEMP